MPNDDIETFKKQLQICKTNIRELEQELQDCKREYADEEKRLKQELEKQKKEVTRLQNIIDEKEKIQNAQMRLLKRELNEQDQKFKEMADKFDSFVKESRKKDDKNKAIQENNLKKLESELKIFQKKALDNEDKLKIYMQKTEQLEKSRAVLYMGQLCANVMTAIYKQVLSSYFTNDGRQPHLSDIEKKIEELSIDHRYKAAVRMRWKTLQKDEKIDEELVNFMEQIMADRNEEAHPSPLNERELRAIARTLPGRKGILFQKVIQVSKDMGLFLLFPSE